MSGVQRTKVEVAEIIEQFLNGSGHEWDWDDFCSYKIADVELDLVRIRCRQLGLIYPPTETGRYCGDAGFEIMRAMITELRAAK